MSDKEPYISRINEHYELHDAKNCERVFNCISRLGNCNRSKRAMYNLVFGLLSQIIILALGFIIQAVSLSMVQMSMGYFLL